VGTVLIKTIVQMSNVNFKDKDQSILEFYETLQIEYVVCDLRRRIYPREKDKKFFQKTCNFKEAKIKDIAERNQLPSLFDSDVIKREILAKVHNEYGIPNFIYRNEAERVELKAKDIYHYFREGSEVKVKTETGHKFGIITRTVDSEWRDIDNSGFKSIIILNDEVIFVKFRGEAEETMVSTSRVSRIV
jgi:hypothetical protein